MRFPIRTNLSVSLWISLALVPAAVADPPVEFVVPKFEAALPAEAVLLKNQSLPYLYHWTSQKSLSRFDGSTILKKISARYEHFIIKKFGMLAETPGLFAWSNPVGGMGASKGEIYADVNEPALLRLRMKSNLNILVLHSNGWGPGQVLDPALLKDADVIFHSYGYGEHTEFREFVILKDSAVEAYAADPAVMRDDLSKWMRRFEEAERLEDAAYMSIKLLKPVPVKDNGIYTAETEYTSVYRKYFKSRAEKFLGTPQWAIPARFRSPSLAECVELVTQPRSR